MLLTDSLSHALAFIAATLLALTVPSSPAGGRQRQTSLASTTSLPNNTEGYIFHNAGNERAADPYTLWDERTGYYYAYSTLAPDPGYYFAIYRSPDLSTWQRMPGGALKGCDEKNSTQTTGNVCWSSDSRWAPEVYHNKMTGWYFLFHTARLKPELRKNYFRYSLYIDAWKIGVAKSRSPLGPFDEIKARPIEWYPFDPDNVDINLIMGMDQRATPKRKVTHGLPRGVYGGTIDPNLYFSEDGRIYLFVARNYGRNARFDEKFRKYVFESEIWGVELNTTWWNDPSASTMPAIIDAEKDRFHGQGSPLPHNITHYNATGELGYPPRKDGFTRVIAPRLQPQAWENETINAYNDTQGAEVDRRETEGSTTISRKDGEGKITFVTFYSANNLETETYGVGYAVADHPMGPYVKSPDNPVLHYVNGTTSLPGIYGPGHGSVVASRAEGASSNRGAQRRAAKQRAMRAANDSIVDDMNGMRRTPAGAELFYVHHAHLNRDNFGADRRLYTSRMTLNVAGLGGNGTRASGDAPLTTRLTSKDQPLPKGTAPIKMTIDQDSVACSKPHGHTGTFNKTAKAPQRSKGSMSSNVVLEVAVRSDSGALFDIGEPSNRLLLTVTNGGGYNESSVVPIYTETNMEASLAVYRAPPLERGDIFAISYQRNSVSGEWLTVERASLRCI